MSVCDLTELPAEDCDHCALAGHLRRVTHYVGDDCPGGHLDDGSGGRRSHGCRECRGEGTYPGLPAGFVCPVCLGTGETEEDHRA